MNLIPKLESVSLETGNIGILAKYLLEYDGDVSKLKTSHLCDELFISAASTTRLAKRLGLDGFPELKIYLQQEREANLKASNKYSDITAQKYYDDIVNSLAVTLTNASDQQLLAISQEIEKASKVNLFAVGGSNTIITDFGQKLLRIRKSVTYSGDNHFQFVEACNSDESTICIGLSYSGITHEVLANLQTSKQNGATTVLITNNKDVKYDFLDHVVVISSSDNSMRTYSISSRFSSLAILDLLYLNVIETNPEYYNQILEHNRYIK